MALTRRFPIRTTEPWPGGWALLAACAGLFALLPILLFAALPRA
jgi:hypothetical protein